MKMKDLQFQIRRMGQKDLPSAMNIKNIEGWNQTLNDWEFLLYDPSGICLVALHQDEVVATVSAVGYDNKLAWIGMMLVRKEYRGMGLAKMLMKAILEKLEGYPAIKLDATPAGFPIYAALGFVREYSICRMVKPLRKVSKKHPDKPSFSGETSLQDIIDFDQKTYGINRKNLLQYLYQQSPETVRAIKEEKSTRGYIMGRPGTNFHQLGPLIAESTDRAINLISSVLPILEDQAIVVDVLADKKDLIDWLIRQGFGAQRELIRMYYKANPYPGLLTKQYLISGPELG
jgi:GNAT superfamily N-acetyltransferase